MDEDHDIPILLRMAFLATFGARIDVRKGEVKMRVKNEEKTFGIYKARNRKLEKEEVYVL